MMRLEVRLSQGGKKNTQTGGKNVKQFMQMTVVFHPCVWRFSTNDPGWCVKMCFLKEKKRKSNIPFSSLFLGRCLLAVDFTSATSPLSPYIHFGSSLGPPPHSSAPVRGFPAACQLHAHIWTEDVTEQPPSSLQSALLIIPTPSAKDGDWRCNKWRLMLPGKANKQTINAGIEWTVSLWEKNKTCHIRPVLVVNCCLWWDVTGLVW